MAETDSNPQLAKNEEEQGLKYLEFLQVVAFRAAMYSAKLYTYAKDNSGPLKPGVHTVEGTVKTLVAPVYHKYQAVPVDVLKFVDRKVDESVSKVQSRVTQALKTAQKAPAAARTVISEVKNVGVETASGLAKTAYAKYEPAAKDVYSKYEPVAEKYAASAWRGLNQLPLFPLVAQAVVPAASYWSDKYNQTVQGAAEKGYVVASHVPLVPMERIAKVLGSA